jgi:hypothetical protein
VVGRHALPSIVASREWVKGLRRAREREPIFDSRFSSAGLCRSSVGFSDDGRKMGGSERNRRCLVVCSVNGSERQRCLSS